MLQFADSAVNGCIALQREKNSYPCIDAAHCRVCNSVNGPLRFQLEKPSSLITSLNTQQSVSNQLN